MGCEGTPGGHHHTDSLLMATEAWKEGSAPPQTRSGPAAGARNTCYEAPRPARRGDTVNRASREPLPDLSILNAAHQPLGCKVVSPLGALATWDWVILCGRGCPVCRRMLAASLTH